MFFLDDLRNAGLITKDRATEYKRAERQGKPEAWFGKRKEEKKGIKVNRKAGGRHSSVSYISRLNESMQKQSYQSSETDWNNVRNNTQMIRLCFMAPWLPSLNTVLLNLEIKVWSRSGSNSCCIDFLFPSNSLLNQLSHMQVLAKDIVSHTFVNTS